jgi:hypothetical protein
VALPPNYGPQSLEGLLVASLLWVIGLLAIFVPLAIRMYKRLT